MSELVGLRTLVPHTNDYGDKREKEEGDEYFGPASLVGIGYCERTDRDNGDKVQIQRRQRSGEGARGARQSGNAKGDGTAGAEKSS